jgi:hypothetical protein
MKPTFEQPDFQKEIRLNIASLVSAMDIELEDNVEHFFQWWQEMKQLTQRNACCRAVPIAESNPSQPQDDASHQ